VDLLGIDLSSDDVQHALPAGLAVVAALLKLVPGAVTSARSHASGASVPAANRVRDYQLPVPFGRVWAQRYCAAYTDKATVVARDTMRARTLGTCGTGIVVCLALGGGYLALAVNHGYPRWSEWTIEALTAVGVVLLLLMFTRVRRDTRRKSAARPRSGRLVVSGVREDIVQQCLGALREIGARPVRIHGDRILGYTGIAFFRNVFMGDIIWIVLEPRPGGQRVTITSTKADWVSFSRSNKNVRGFLEAWATFPTNPM
jgi:hypothetical protein